MKEIDTQSARVEWVDIFRGILILLVVVGHSTGNFNQYIYQFHMGAFFIISGYMSQPEKRGVLDTIYHRFFSTYLPLLTATLLLGGVMAVLKRWGGYELLLGDSQYIGIWGTVKELLLHGNFYVWWLGAAWFALALFKISIIGRIILKIDGDRYSILCIFASFLLLLLGYMQADAGKNGIVLITQFYFVAGAYMRHYIDINRIKRSTVVYMGIAGTAIILAIIGNRFGFTVDYPSQKFNNPLVDILMAVNGAAFCFFVSKGIEKLRCIKKILVLLGKNTLPIMLFHFMWFNVAYWLLYLFGVVQLDYLQNFVPTDEIGRTYWPLFVVISIGLSILGWKCIMAWRPLRFAFGQEKALYANGWQCLKGKIGISAADSSENVRPDMKEYAKKGYVVAALCCIILIAAGITARDLYDVGSSLEECKIEAGLYDDGWCGNAVKFKVKTGNLGNIAIEGWTNYALTGHEEIMVLCDGKEIAKYRVSEEAISISATVAPNSVVTIELLSSFSFQAAPPDERELSFIVSELIIT